MPFLASVVKKARRARVWGLLVILPLLLVACGGDSSESFRDSAEPSIFGQGTVEIETREGSVKLDVEIAETREARQLGLMGRTSLPEDAGMMFLSPEPVANAFTMRNTLIPLSVAFMDGDGRILRILDMEPCESETCPAYSPELFWSSALEVNQGAFGRLGVELGDLVRLERS